MPNFIDHAEPPTQPQAQAQDKPKLPDAPKLVGENAELDNKAMADMRKLAEAGDLKALKKFNAKEDTTSSDEVDFKLEPEVAEYKAQLLQALGTPSKNVKKTKSKVTSIEHGEFWAEFSLLDPPAITGPSIPMPNYKQNMSHDIHSCAFVAALTVASYLDPKITPLDVLKAVQPSEESGQDRDGMMEALRKLGVSPKFRKNLTVERLRELVEQKIPVIVTVLPDDWSSDHWCVVRGFSKNGNIIYLNNYKKVDVETFEYEWYDAGEGLVCTKG